MDIGRILSTVPPIVENVFKHLKLRDLDSCSSVCELWKRVAETEKNNREDIFWFFEGLKCSVHNVVHSSYEKCGISSVHHIENELVAQLKDLKLRPYFCLIFATDKLIHEFETLFPSFEYPVPQNKRVRYEDIARKRVYLKTAMKTAVTQYLPDVCKTIYTVSPGIVGSFPNYQPLEIEDGFAISGLMIPSVSGLEVHSFAVDENRYHVSELVPKNCRIKCLLVFVTHCDRNFTTMIRQCLEREQYKMAVGGAIVDRSESLRGSVVAFCGESIEAASVIIKNYDKVSDIEKKLMGFQKTGLLKDRCFAFLIVCVARGFGKFKEYNFESSVFHRLYPEVPLLGIFGNGEIGINYMPDLSKQENDSGISQISQPLKRKPKCFHGYSSVFILVSLKL